MQRINTNMHPQAIVNGTVTRLAVDGSRSYLCVIATADVTVTFENNVAFVVKAGSVWAPIPAPLNALSFAGTGTLITG